jgi:hypothetical protein
VKTYGWEKSLYKRLLTRHPVNSTDRKSLAIPQVFFVEVALLTREHFALGSPNIRILACAIPARALLTLTEKASLNGTFTLKTASTRSGATYDI